MIIDKEEEKSTREFEKENGRGFVQEEGQRLLEQIEQELPKSGLLTVHASVHNRIVFHGRKGLSSSITFQNNGIGHVDAHFCVYIGTAPQDGFNYPDRTFFWERFQGRVKAVEKLEWVTESGEKYSKDALVELICDQVADGIAATYRLAG